MLSNREAEVLFFDQFTRSNTSEVTPLPSFRSYRWHGSLSANQAVFLQQNRTFTTIQALSSRCDATNDLFGKKSSCRLICRACFGLHVRLMQYGFYTSPKRSILKAELVTQGPF